MSISIYLYHKFHFQYSVKVVGYSLLYMKHIYAGIKFQERDITFALIEDRLEAIWNIVMGSTMISLQVGVTLLFLAYLLRRIPRVSKQDWVVNSRRTFTILGIILLVLTVVIRSGNGFGAGGGNGIGFGDENSNGKDDTVEDSDSEGKTSDEAGNGNEMAHSEQDEEQIYLSIMSNAEIVIRIHGKDIYYQEQIYTVEQLENLIRDAHNDGMLLRLQDDYADDITYSQILKILDTYQIRYEKERLE